MSKPTIKSIRAKLQRLIKEDKIVNCALVNESEPFQAASYRLVGDRRETGGDMLFDSIESVDRWLDDLEKRWVVLTKEQAE